MDYTKCKHGPCTQCTVTVWELCRVHVIVVVYIDCFLILVVGVCITMSAALSSRPRKQVSFCMHTCFGSNCFQLEAKD